MKKRLYFVAFISGAIAGAAVAWEYAKKKYEQIAEEEISSVKEVFSKKEQKTDDEGEHEYSRMMENQAKEKPKVGEYASILKKNGYSNQSKTDEKRKEGKVMKYDQPYVITPEEFGEYEDYEQIELIYYADKILADENDETIEDIDTVIGDALRHFGEYEDDSVFVRCDERQCDYEILLDQRNFSDVIKIKPHRMEGE